MESNPGSSSPTILTVAELDDKNIDEIIENVCIAPAVLYDRFRSIYTYQLEIDSNGVTNFSSDTAGCAFVHEKCPSNTATIIMGWRANR